MTVNCCFDFFVGVVPSVKLENRNGSANESSRASVLLLGQRSIHFVELMSYLEVVFSECSLGPFYILKKQNIITFLFKK